MADQQNGVDANKLIDMLRDQRNRLMDDNMVLSVQVAQLGERVEQQDKLIETLRGIAGTKENGNDEESEFEPTAAGA